MLTLKVQFHIQFHSQPPRKTMKILTKVFYTSVQI